MDRIGCTEYVHVSLQRVGQESAIKYPFFRWAILFLQDCIWYNKKGEGGISNAETVGGKQSREPCVQIVGMVEHVTQEDEEELGKGD